MFTLSLAVIFPYFQFSEIHNINNSTVCGVSKPLLGFIMDTSDFCLSLIIPFVISISLNSQSGYHLIKNKMKLNSKTLKREKRLLVVLISMDLAYFLCFTPWFAYIISKDVLMLTQKSTDFMLTLRNATSFIYYLHSTCSFFIYYACNKQFRSYFKRMIGVKQQAGREIIN